MGSGKFENKHGVGVLVNEKWGKHVTWTDNISERAIATSITVNKQHVLLMSVYFSHSGCADFHVEKMYRSIEIRIRRRRTSKLWEETSMPNLGPEYGVERVSVGPHTLKEGNERRLDEAMADDTKLHSTQHDVQENT